MISQTQYSNKDEQSKLFDRFFSKDLDTDQELSIMNQLHKKVEDDLDIDFWYTAMRWHLGKKVVDNSETECIKAACCGENELADVFAKISSRKNDLKTDTENISKGDSIPEMQIYTDIDKHIDVKTVSDSKWKKSVDKYISDELENAVLARDEKTSSSLDELYLKSVIKRDNSTINVIEYVKSMQEN